MKNSIVYIGDKSYSFLLNTYIGGIYIFDLLPIVKETRIITNLSATYLCVILPNISERNFLPMSSDNLTSDDINRVIKDEIILQSLSRLLLAFYSLNTNKENYDVYDLVKVFKRISSSVRGGRTPRYVRLRSKPFLPLLSLILELPTVNPLLCSIITSNEEFIDKYLDNVRNNYFEVCVYCINNRITYNTIVDSILYKIFLCKQIFMLIHSYDIYKYMLYIRVF